MHPYRPEGLTAVPPSPELIRKSAGTGEIFQARCFKCDEHYQLHVDLGSIRGIIPRQETALGIPEGRTREIAIMSRVGKTVSFQVLEADNSGTAVLSRRAAQSDARSYFFSALRPGDVIPAVVQNPASFGVFCDIGCGFPALMRIERCCVSRLRSTGELFHTGQEVYACVLGVDDRRGFIHLTGRELLGTWEENAAAFRPGQTVTGIVRSIMPYGLFIELTPNLSGLAEPQEGIAVGDGVSVYIRSIQPQHHKIKLTILEKLPSEVPAPPLSYQINSGHLSLWEYYPGSSARTDFDAWDLL